jgi:hypothetical protein
MRLDSESNSPTVEIKKPRRQALQIKAMSRMKSPGFMPCTRSILLLVSEIIRPVLLKFAPLLVSGLMGQAAKSKEAHLKTIISSKSLACVAVDYLSDSRFRDEVKKYFKDH